MGNTLILFNHLKILWGFFHHYYRKRTGERQETVGQKGYRLELNPGHCVKLTFALVAHTYLLNHQGTLDKHLDFCMLIQTKLR